MFEIEQLLQHFFDIPSPAFKPKWVEVMSEMAVHAHGWRPEKLIDTQRPNEDKEIKRYRIDNYRPITKRGIGKSIDKLSAIFSQSGFVIKTDEDTLDYIKGSNFQTDVFEMLTLNQYFEKVIIPRHIVDPNGLVVVAPGAPKEINEKLEPEIVIVPSAKVKHIHHEFISFLSEEKSEVKANDKTVKEGKVYHIYTKEQFWKLKQVGQMHDDKYEAEFVYQHDLGLIPFTIMGGIKEKGFYNSFFDSYLPLADEAVVAFSDYQAVRVLSAFPVKEMAAIECDFVGCGGRGYLDDDKICPKCHGSGQFVPVSPYQILMRSERSAAMGEQIDTRPMLEYHSPDVNILKFVDEQWKELLKEAEKSLNLIFVDEAQSGVAKAIDREDSDMMLNKIANNLFDNLMTNIIYYIGLYRGEIDEKPTIIRPSSFRIKTEAELSEELGMLVEKAAPHPFIIEATKDLSSKRFSGDEVARRIFEILPEFDPYFGKSVQDLLQLNISGAVTVDEIRKSQTAYALIQELIRREGSQVLFDDNVLILLEELFTSKRINPIIDGTQ